jgi:predicted DNA-binding transcriptional regulator AlpA
MKTLIQECLENNVDVTLTVKASDLTAFGQYLIDNAAREAAEQKRLKDEDVLYSVDEVMKVLNIKNRTTIWRWQKSGYLVPVKVGKMCRYRKSDVDAILNVERAK